MIWDHFGFEEADEEQKRAMCRICGKVVSAPLGNTSNLFSHIRVSHKVVHDETLGKIQKTGNVKVKDKVQSSIPCTLFNATKYTTTSDRHKALTESIGYFLAKDMHAINTVEGEGFKKMIQAFDKRYALPSRHHFSRTVLPGMYEDVRKTVSNDLLQADHFAATTDLWSSRTAEPYICLTIHYIDAEFNLQAKCLQTAFMPEVHTGQNIADVLREALAQWHLNEEKLVCITTDNAANVNLATEINGWMRQQCFGHRLHLAIGE